MSAHVDWRPTQETDHVPIGRICLAFGIMVGVSFILIAWACSTVWLHEAHLRPHRVFPERALELHAAIAGLREDLYGKRGIAEQFEAPRKRALEEYRWVERDAGTITIPIERAMELEVEEQP